jgi:hypothetical protein
MSWSFAATSECGTSVITSPIMLSTLYTTMARTNKNDTEIKGEMHLLTSWLLNIEKKRKKSLLWKSLTYTCTCKILSDIYINLIFLFFFLSDFYLRNYADTCVG